MNELVNTLRQMAGCRWANLYEHDTCLKAAADRIETIEKLLERATQEHASIGYAHSAAIEKIMELQTAAARERDILNACSRQLDNTIRDLNQCKKDMAELESEFGIQNDDLGKTLLERDYLRSENAALKERVKELEAAGKLAVSLSKISNSDEARVSLENDSLRARFARLQSKYDELLKWAKEIALPAIDKRRPNPMLHPQDRSKAQNEMEDAFVRFPKDSATDVLKERT